MIALAVAALLTLTALTIWAVRTIHRPIDWNLAPGWPHWLPPVERLQAIQPGDTIIATIPHDWAPTKEEDLEQIISKLKAKLPGHEILVFTDGITLTTAAADTPATTRALRASERDDHRREGQ